MEKLENINMDNHPKSKMINYIFINLKLNKTINCRAYVWLYRFQRKENKGKKKSKKTIIICHIAWAY